MAKRVTTTPAIPELLRVKDRSTPLADVLVEAVRAGLPIVLPTEGNHSEIEDSSAVDLALSREPRNGAVPAPPPGTSYAGLTPGQRFTFLQWSNKPEEPAPVAYQQLFLANLETRLLEDQHRQRAIQQITKLGSEPTWTNNPAIHRTLLLACWLEQDGQRLAEWISAHTLPADLMGIALGLQALIDTPLTASELGAVVSAWKLGDRLPTDLLKLRLDSLTAILGQPPLAHSLSLLDPNATVPRPWRTAHRGLRLLIPQPDLRPILEPPLRDLLSVADWNKDDTAATGTVELPDTDLSTTPTDEEAQPSLEELGWRLILEFGSNRSEYFDYVLTQAQKLPGYSQIMDEDRRIVYRIIFRKSEMRRFWRIWDYVQGWTATRVYLNGVELEKWKVWPYSQYLR